MKKYFFIKSVKNDGNILKYWFFQKPRAWGCDGSGRKWPIERQACNVSNCLHKAADYTTLCIDHSLASLRARLLSNCGGLILAHTHRVSTLAYPTVTLLNLLRRRLSETLITGFQRSCQTKNNEPSLGDIKCESKGMHFIYFYLLRFIS